MEKRDLGTRVRNLSNYASAQVDVLTHAQFINSEGTRAKRSAKGGELIDDIWDQSRNGFVLGRLGSEKGLCFSSQGEGSAR